MNIDILITTRFEKEKLLKKYSLEKKIEQIKIYTIEEIESLYYGTLHPLSLYETVKEFKLQPSIAKLMLSYIHDIDNSFSNDKTKKIIEIKNHLLEKGYIEKSNIFKNFFQNKKIIFYHITLNKKQEKIKEILEQNNEVLIEEEKIEKKPLKIYGFYKIEEEVLFVASTITKLIQNNIDINHIKILLSSNDYDAIIFRIFSIFHIPFYNSQENLSNYPLSQKFLKCLEKETLKEALETIKNHHIKEQKIYDSIINITNPYIDMDDDISKEVIAYQIKNKKISLQKYTNIVSFVSLDDVIDEEDILFIMGVNQGYFPKIYTDDEFLSDEEKNFFHMDTSKDKNKQEKVKVLKKIYNTKNLYLSYKLVSDVNYLKSSVIEEENMEEIKEEYHYTNYDYNMYLRSKALDYYIKYHEKTNNFEQLFSLKNEDYLSYDNSYHVIDYQEYQEYMKHYIRLSYSTLTTFFKCSFRFYMSKILKIYDDKTSSSLQVGNIVHNVLCRVLKENRKDFENIIDEEIEKVVPENTSKIKFYKNKWKKEITLLIHIILKQNENTEFQNTYLEELFEIPFKRDMLMILEGKIDKVMTYKRENNLYTLIVDYKTGTIDTDFNPVYYGLNMQLLIYYYLLLKTKDNVHLAGLYYQNIMKNLMNRVDDKTYDELLLESYKLEGYTREDLILLPKLVKDLDYSFIKGLKVKKDGSFYSTSKVLNENKIEKLVDMTENHLKNAFEKIEKASFDIHPIQIGNEKKEEATGCKYCPYMDICYKRSKDFKHVKKQEKLSFLEEGDL